MKQIFIAILLLLCISVQGQDINDVLLRAKACIDNENYNDAITLYSAAIDSRSHYRIYTGRADAYLLSGDTDKAISDYLSANSLAIASGDYGLARAYARKGMVDKSVESLIRHLRSPYKYEKKVILLDKDLGRIEESPQWRKLWKTDWYNQLENGIAEIEYLLTRGSIEDIERIYKELAVLYSDKTDIAYLEGIIAMKKNNFRIAIEKLHLVTENDSGNYKAWMAYIDALSKNRDYLVAANKCTDALLLFPENSEIILIRAYNLNKAGDKYRALEVCESYLQIYPEKEEAIQMAGRIASESGKYGKALRYFSNNIDADPGNPEYFSDRAGVYFKTKSWESAIYDFSMALDLHPQNGENYYMKGMALLKISRVDEACHDFKKALHYGYKKASVMINKNCIR